MDKQNECYVCTGGKPGYFNRCEKHDTCLTCGIHRKELKEAPWGKLGGFTCKPCATAATRKRIVDFQATGDDDFDYLNRAKCPYCGEEFDPESGDDGEIDCPECESTMMLTPDYDVTYSTSKHESNPEYKDLLEP